MTEFNWVDLVILILVISAASNGFMQGAAVQVFSYAGFILGLLLGAKLGPLAGQLVENPAIRVAVVVMTLFATASLLGTIGKFIGARATWGVPRPSLFRILNSFGGLGVAVLVTLLSTWLIGGMLAQLHVLGEVSAAMQTSKVLRGLTEKLPPAPAVFSSIQRTLLPSGFPPVFTEMEPIAPDVPVTGDPDLAAIVGAVRPSVVKITADGCGRRTSGSGFVAGPGLVVTNAHVIAGVERPVVTDSEGTHRTTVVLFDPDMDLAVLRASGLAGRPLALQREVVPRGQQGGVLGYPAGGPFTAQPGVVRDHYRDAVGRDIYSRSTVSRNVYQIGSRVSPGNSGGPFVAPGGEVIGVIFASSIVNPDIAYALNSADVGVRVDRARSLTAPVDTGPCAR